MHINSVCIVRARQILFASACARRVQYFDMAQLAVIAPKFENMVRVARKGWTADQAILNVAEIDGVWAEHIVRSTTPEYEPLSVNGTTPSNRYVLQASREQRQLLRCHDECAADFAVVPCCDIVGSEPPPNGTHHAVIVNTARTAEESMDGDTRIWTDPLAISAVGAYPRAEGYVSRYGPKTVFGIDQ